MPKIVNDLRAAAANPASLTKAEIVDLLLTAAERIEEKQIALTRARHDTQRAPRTADES